MIVIERARYFVKGIISVTAAKYVNLFWKWHRRQFQPHNLPGPLTVTLTSYPPRFSTLALTVKSLLAQSVRPDRVCLWIAESDFALLPENVRKLENSGLEIKTCEDLKSYKKIIPALLEGNRDFLLTADDDQYYPRHWLRDLLGGYEEGQKAVFCGRARRIRLDSAGAPLPYLEWENDVPATGYERLLLPTGLSGVLYEPGIFHADVTRSDIFLDLCPTGDDVWLYWMAALNGARFRKVGPKRREINWADSQRVSLFAVNRTANDEQIAKMMTRYGLPG